jgi:hypothetical protein
VSRPGARCSLACRSPIWLAARRTVKFTGTVWLRNVANNSPADLQRHANKQMINFKLPGGLSDKRLVLICKHRLPTRRRRASGHERVVLFCLLAVAAATSLASASSLSCACERRDGRHAEAAKLSTPDGDGDNRARLAALGAGRHPERAPRPGRLSRRAQPASVAVGRLNWYRTVACSRQTPLALGRVLASAVVSRRPPVRASGRTTTTCKSAAGLVAVWRSCFISWSYHNVSALAEPARSASHGPVLNKQAGDTDLQLACRRQCQLIGCSLGTKARRSERTPPPVN